MNKLFIVFYRDENVHRFALSAIRGKLLEREREEREKEREREREREKEVERECDKKSVI